MSEAGDFSDNLDSNSGDSEYILEHEEEDDESSEEEVNIFSQSSTFSTVSRASASDEKKRKREALEIFFSSRNSAFDTLIDAGIVTVISIVDI